MKLVLKVAVTVLLLAALAYKLDWSQVFAAVAGLDWWILPIAVCVQLAVLCTANARWWLLLRRHGTRHRFLELLPQYLVAAFFNNALPTATGGDVLRMYYVYKQRLGAAAAVSPVIMERVIGMATLIGIATTVLPFVSARNAVVEALERVLPAAFGLALLALALLGLPATYRPLHEAVARWRHRLPVAALLRIAEASHRYLHHGGLLVRLVALSVTIQLMEAGLFFLLGTGVGAGMPAIDYLFIVPLVFVASALPVTVGGYGVREVTAVMLFSAFGMTQGAAAAVALLFIPVLVLSSLPGLYFFLRTKERRAVYKDGFGPVP